MDDRDPSEHGRGATRRSVLGGAGAMGIASVLAACGGGGGGGGTGGSGSDGTPTGGPGASRPTTVSPPIKTSDVPVGGGIVVEGRGVVITQPIAGTFKAFDATCTHQGCEVANVSSGKINCPCHGSQFNVADGSVARGPALAPLASKRVTVSGGTITVS